MLKAFEGFPVIRRVPVRPIHEQRGLIMIGGVDHVVHNGATNLAAVDFPSVGVLIAEFASEPAAEKLRPDARIHSL
jgi:hypothetical protein